MSYKCLLFSVSGKKQLYCKEYQLQLSGVIPWYNITLDCIHNCSNWYWTWIRFQTHKRHPIPRPHRRAMGCLLWDLWRRLTMFNGTHSILNYVQPYSRIPQLTQTAQNLYQHHSRRQIYCYSALWTDWVRQHESDNLTCDFWLGSLFEFCRLLWRDTVRNIRYSL